VNPHTRAEFRRMYAAAPDPWRLADRAYEQRKYGITVASLPAPHYASAFEPGCSVGVLTRMLAERCDRLLSCDAADVAVEQARTRTADLDHVRVERRELPHDWPTDAEPFDLIVLSELLYYFEPPERADLLRRARASLAPGGTIVAVHWRPAVPEHVGTAEDVHDDVRALDGMVGLVEHREPDFLLDVVVDARGRAAGELSPAAREGLR